MAKAIKLILYILLAIILYALFIYNLHLGLKKAERIECLQWKRYEKEFPGFYWTKWQILQCAQFDIYPEK